MKEQAIYRIIEISGTLLIISFAILQFFPHILKSITNKESISAFLAESHIKRMIYLLKITISFLSLEIILLLCRDLSFDKSLVCFQGIVTVCGLFLFIVALILINVLTWAFPFKNETRKD